MVCCVVFSGLYFTRFNSAVNIQKITRAEDPTFKDDINYYDAVCSTLAVKEMSQFIKSKNREAGVAELTKTARWSDPEQAYDLMAEIYVDCDEECVKKGTGWSYAILANGLLMILLFCNLGCLAMGSIRLRWRLMTTYLAFILCFVHLGILIFTATVRFSKQGTLCSLYEYRTNAATTNVREFNETWTYAKDGSLIVALWVLQILGSTLCCILGGI